MSSVDVSPQPSTATWRRDLLLLAVAFGALYFFALGRPPLANPDEGRYAEIPREMIVSGDWVTPRLDGVKYFEKPPLMYWAVAACAEVFGQGEGSFRTMPVLFGIGGVLLVYAAGRRIHGRIAGLWSAIVLGTSALYAALARLLILDMAVSVLMAATLICFILGVREAAGERRRWLFYGLYASAALATLTKGLIGFLVTGAVMALWLLVFNQWRRLRPMHLPVGIAIFLAIAAPWHVLAAQRNPTWAHFYLVTQHWERFTTQQHGRFHPWYWFIPIFLGGLFPWVGFLWRGVAGAVEGGWSRRRENADRWFFLVWAAFIFVFFSASQSKLAPYILPVFPPVAILIGATVARGWEGRVGTLTRRGIQIFSVISAVLAFGVLSAVAFPDTFRLDWDQARALKPYAYVLAGILDAGAIVGLRSGRKDGLPRVGVVAIAATFTLFFATLELASPLLYPPSTKEVAQVVRNMARPGDRVFHYAGFFHDFLVYSGTFTGAVGFHGDEVELDNDPVAAGSGRFIEKPEFLKDWEGPGRIFVVAKRSNVDAGKLLADPAFHYHLLLETRDFSLISNQP